MKEYMKTYRKLQKEQIKGYRQAYKDRNHLNN